MLSTSNLIIVGLHGMTTYCVGTTGHRTGCAHNGDGVAATCFRLHGRNGLGRLHATLARMWCGICTTEHVASPGEHGCTTGAPDTWIEDVLLDLQTALRDANGRTTPHSVVTAINTVGPLL